MARRLSAVVGNSLFEIVWSQDGGSRSAYMEVLVARFQKENSQPLHLNANDEIFLAEKIARSFSQSDSLVRIA